MPATTVKLDGVILKDLRAMKPAGGTLTSLVRDLLESEIRRRKMALAAVEYSAFLSEHPDEAGELDAWADAPLERDLSALPRPARAKRR